MHAEAHEAWTNIRQRLNSNERCRRPYSARSHRSNVTVFVKRFVDASPNQLPGKNVIRDTSSSGVSAIVEYACRLKWVIVKTRKL